MKIQATQMSTAGGYHSPIPATFQLLWRNFGCLVVSPQIGFQNSLAHRQIGSSLTSVKKVILFLVHTSDAIDHQLNKSTGYYRVIYDEKNLNLIQEQLMKSHTAISKKNRAQILDDYLNMARANLTSYVSAMELTLYLIHEQDYAPWTAASVALDYIDVMFYSLPDEKTWKVRFIIIF